MEANRDQPKSAQTNHLRKSNKNQGVCLEALLTLLQRGVLARNTVNSIYAQVRYVGAAYIHGRQQIV